MVYKQAPPPQEVPDFHACLYGPTLQPSEYAVLRLARISHIANPVVLDEATELAPVDDWVALELVARGSDLVCHVLGYPELTVTSGEATAYPGLAGLAVFGCPAKFDNFLLAALAPSDTGP
jgi:hypothetical protein